MPASSKNNKATRDIKPSTADTHRDLKWGHAEGPRVKTFMIAVNKMT